MKAWSPYLTVFLIALCITSCKKDDDANPDGNIKPGAYQIIFIENTEGASKGRFEGELKCIDANGDNQIDVTSNGSIRAVEFLSTTYDKTRLSFQGISDFRCPSRDIFTLDIESLKLERKTRSVNDALTNGCTNLNTYSDPWWSPDGSAIAAVKSGGNRNDIVILDTQGTELINLSTILNLELKRHYKPRWSPDGTKLAFATRHFIDVNKTMALWKIVVINRDGTNPVFIGASSAAIIEPKWSPDGNQISYGVFEQNPLTLETSLNTSRIMNSDGTNDRFLTSQLEYVFSSTWFSDNRRILAKVDFDNNSDHLEIAIIDSQTGDYERLTFTDALTTNSAPALSPDEEWILYTAGRHGVPGVNSRNLWKIKPDGTENQQLTTMNHVGAGVWVVK